MGTWPNFSISSAQVVCGRGKPLYLSVRLPFPHNLTPFSNSCLNRFWDESKILSIFWSTLVHITLNQLLPNWLNFLSRDEATCCHKLSYCNPRHQSTSNFLVKILPLSSTHFYSGFFSIKVTLTNFNDQNIIFVSWKKLFIQYMHLELSGS
jgi:hypothetical protein